MAEVEKQREITVPSDGLEFVFDDPEELFKRIERGNGGRIAHALLSKPFKSAEIFIYSEGDEEFDITGTLQLHSEGRKPSDENRAMTAVNACHELLNDFGVNVEERGGSHLMSGTNGTPVVFYAMSSSNQILVSNGRSIDEETGKELDRAPLPKLTRNTLENAMTDVNEVMNLILRHVYFENGKTLPDFKAKTELPTFSTDYYSEITNEGMNNLTVGETGVTFDDIGGQDNAKKEMQGLAYAISNPDIYKKWGTKPPKGILLHGPPGTGKTLLAKALATSADANFISVQTSDFSSVWFGESERMVRSIFDAANSGGRTIIYFDEIDSIVPKRDGQHEATQKIIATILQNIDGIDTSDAVTVVASTNRKDSIDPAMLRPGRLDKLVEVPLPDVRGREHILAVHMKAAEAIAERSLFSRVDREMIAAKTNGYTGADLAELVRRSLETRLRLEKKGEKRRSQVSTKDLQSEVRGYERKTDIDTPAGLYL